MGFLFCLQLSIHCSHTLTLSAAAATCSSVLCQWLFLYRPPLPPSVSILLFHCLFTSLHRPCSVTLSPLATSYNVSSLCRFLSLILLTGSNSLSSLSPPPLSPPLYLAGYIRSSVRSLGLWQPVSYSEWFWYSCVHVSVYGAVMNVFLCVRVSWCLSPFAMMPSLICFINQLKTV